MAKIYYTVDTTTLGYPVCWTDAAGQLHIEKLEVAKPSPSDIDQEFRLLHPGAVFLTRTQMDTRLAKLELERQQLKYWNEGK